MRFFVTILTITALIKASFPHALGINCRGSGLCLTSSYTLLDLKSVIENGALDPNAVFPNGQQVACCSDEESVFSSGLCVFPQNIGGGGTVTGAQVIQAINDLLAHKCTICGSDPTEPGNNVADGQITVNYVSVSCGNHVCLSSDAVLRVQELWDGEPLENQVPDYYIKPLDVERGCLEISARIQRILTSLQLSRSYARMRRRDLEVNLARRLASRPLPTSGW